MIINVCAYSFNCSFLREIRDKSTPALGGLLSMADRYLGQRWLGKLECSALLKQTVLTILADGLSSLLINSLQ